MGAWTRWTSYDRNEHNRFYLETKAARSGHYVDLDGKRHLPEQGEPVIIEESA